MPEEDFNQQPEETEEEKVPFVPASTAKRIWAWMGIVYAVIIMILITYWIATTQFITGITGIMLFPFLGACTAQGINNCILSRKGLHGQTFSKLLITTIIMGLLAASSLIWGILQIIGG